CQVRREGQPNVCAGTAPGHRPVDHRVTVPEAAGEDGGVLVLRRHDRSEPREGDEVFRPGERYQRPTGRIGRVGDDPFAAVLDPGQARVFHAPRLFGVAARVGGEAGAGVDVPVRDAVVAPGDGQVRMAAAVLDADEQNGFVAD